MILLTGAYDADKMKTDNLADNPQNSGHKIHNDNDDNGNDDNDDDNDNAI